MGDSYVEVLVERDRNTSYAALKVIMFVLCGICILASLVVSSVLFFVGVALGIIGAFVVPHPDYEYEYLLLNKELSIDKIIDKSKRKKVAEYDLNNMEIMCPASSHELDSYKNKNTPSKDFSSGRADSKPYVIVYHESKGDELVYIEPDDEMMKVIKTLCPRKVVEY